ncbi:MAG: 50S ribosomal protein L21 [Candidatus Rokubacteria bacterium]|nr:50S ribosomal protein L21 [Candidatus Rokubacteria bacterium]
MEAVIVSGGKQYRVREGDVVRVERLPAEQGATVEFDDIAYLRDNGGPVVERSALAGARVLGQVVSIGRAPKVVVLKFKRRKNYTRRQGHRQGYTAVRITRIEVGR